MSHSTTADLARLGLLMSLTCIGCEPRSAPGTPWSGTVRDSAGVRIVEHAEVPADLPVWSVDTAPELSIGSIERGADVFGGIRDVVRRSDGVIVVAEFQVREIRAFAPDGAHLWTSGGQGEGPGEFQNLSGIVAMPGDSLLVRDGNMSRVSVLDENGAFQRSRAVEPLRDGWGRPSEEGVFRDGTIAAMAMDLPSSVANGYTRRFNVVATMDPAGQPLGEYGPLPGQGLVWTIREDLGGASGRTVLFDLPPEVGVGPDFVAVSHMDRFRISLLDGSAAPISEIRTLEEPIPSDRDRYIAFRVSQTDDPDAQRRLRESLQDDELFGEVVPRIRTIVVDPLGRIWAQEYVVYEDRPATWWIIDREGAFIGQTVMPEAFTPHQFLEEHVLGVWEDELEVQYVRLYRIARGPGLPEVTP